MEHGSKIVKARQIFANNVKSIAKGQAGNRARVLGLLRAKCQLTPGAASRYYQIVREEFINAGTLTFIS